MTDLKPGMSYDINVKSIAGQKIPEGDAVYCLCEGNLSNTLPVTCAAPPTSPHIYIEGMTPEGNSRQYPPSLLHHPASDSLSLFV